MAAPPPLRRPPALMDELMEEILLRLPPNKPVLLVRAALVCKRWCRLVADPGFRHRFHQFHRTPPMLGLIICHRSPDAATTTTRFIPTSSFCPSDTSCRRWCLLNARHGRILFYYNPAWSNPKMRELTVWTPATGEVRKLPMLQFLCSPCVYWNAALLCVVPGCDHMECPSGGPYTVVLVGRTLFKRFTHAYVYSSEADKWSHTAYTDQHGYVKQRCTYSALVENALYFLGDQDNGILEYSLAKKELLVIRLPPIMKTSAVVLMSVENGGGLGFAMMHDFTLCIWLRLRESATTLGGGWTWTQHKIVELKSFVPVSGLSSSPYILAAADAVSVFVIGAGDAGILAIDIKSGRVTKVSDADGHTVNIIPYMSFFTPALRTASIDDGPSTIASNNA